MGAQKMWFGMATEVWKRIQGIGSEIQAGEIIANLLLKRCDYASKIEDCLSQHAFVGWSKVTRFFFKQPSWHSQINGDLSERFQGSHRDETPTKALSYDVW